MNYLGHYVYNHQIQGLPPDPYFILGAALPDLWTRFSRRRRLRWKAIREAEPSDPRARRLRDGLLNHVAADRRFHGLAIFNGWQKELKGRHGGGCSSSSLLDFLTHLALELALDHRLLVESPRVGEEIYDRIALCDYEVVEREISPIGDVDASGLADEVRLFVGRRFLPRFIDVETIPPVVEYVLGLASVREKPSFDVIRAVVGDAVRIIEPARVWAEMLVGDGGGVESASIRALVEG